ncbi:hypothetical protein MUG91_G7n102 [Manis pentadactyla]|nr:hypothetical protein MUG91_G7n102 [Manis pentadactyla]
MRVQGDDHLYQVKANWTGKANSVIDHPKKIRATCHYFGDSKKTPQKKNVSEVGPHPLIFNTKEKEELFFGRL